MTDVVTIVGVEYVDEVLAPTDGGVAFVLFWALGPQVDSIS